MTTAKCPTCHKPYARLREGRYCPHCGTELRGPAQPLDVEVDPFLAHRPLDFSITVTEPAPVAPTPVPEAPTAAPEPAAPASAPDTSTPFDSGGGSAAP